MDWDDLRYFLALSREGAVRAAAKRLKVSHSTVTRRVQSFEDRLGVRLFDRTPDGFVLTATGEQILPTAEMMEEQATALERDVLGRDSKLEGNICLTVPNGLLHTAIMDDIVRFTVDYPEIEIEIVQSYSFADLSRREADIAVRYIPIGSSPPDHLVGRKIGRSFHCTYMATNGLKTPDDPFLIGWGDGSRHPAWVKQLPVPPVPVRHAINDAQGQREACASGLGYATLDCFQADIDPRLKRVPGYSAWPSRDIWLLTHPDIKATARFRLFRQAITDAFLNHAGKIGGSGRDD